jgi:hypothetical protein
MLIHERFFIFAKQRIYATAFSIWISVTIDVPTGCFLL